MYDIYTVSAVNGNTSSARDKTYDLVSRNRITALREMHIHVVNTLDNNRIALVLFRALLIGCGIILDLLQNFFIAENCLVISVIKFGELVDYLTLFETAMTDCRKNGVPVAESVFALDCFLIDILANIRQNKSFCFAICRYEFSALYDIFILEFLLEPLIYLVAGLRTLGDAEPVAARAL